ncbi:MAG TPA: single-stranded-DNA-specific exonuclease RecJ [Woeseiaceae bacterium]|nr:single-stranded-DNA-specific exonuclease RecJ [Woeseiaceae bacterium]
MTLTRERPVRRRKLPGAAAVAGLSGLDPVLARLYAARGISAEAELDLTLQRLAPVRTLTGVDGAVAVLMRSRRRRIIVIGDFDVDGATSTALVVRCLRDFGFADVDYLVPNRFEYGYGLTPEIVRVAAGMSPALLLTVDNGVSSLEGVAEARSLGIEVVITDHHLPGVDLPEAAAIVNPNLAGSTFGSPNLAGVGVAFYVMAALGKALQREGQQEAARIPARYLDLVALGTVADVVRLDQNNRILVTQGLRRIRAGSCVAGIRALLAVAGRHQERVSSTDLGFAVGPRLNAAGRLEDMSVGIECLLTDDADSAMRSAEALDRINHERRDIESSMRDQAFAFIDRLDEEGLPGCVCVYDQSWHQGVVGLIASRVKERCHRPVIAFAREQDGQLKGSARSVPGIHIRDLLEAISTVRPGLVPKFGGHAMAAGLSLPAAHLEEFKVLACEQLSRLYPQADFSGVLLSDGALPASSMNLDFARLLRDGGPWGAGFPEPLWCGDFELIEQRIVGGLHLKLKVRPLDGESQLDAIAFNQASAAFRGSVRMAYRLDVNQWRGVESPQLVVEQISRLASQTT